ncbi:glycoside hydrolase family 18 protein, partial [Jeongeupia naejangsanensis]
PTPTPTPPTPTPTPTPTAAPTVQAGSYFAQWGIYGRNYQVADIGNSGAAAKLTFINYAFGNLYQKNGGYECGIINKLEPGATDPNAPDAGTGGDAWADYQKGFAGDAWGWPAWDDPRNGVSGPLKGNFNQLKQLKAKYPNLKVFISLGGWTWSKWFSAAASTDALRKQLVSSCIDVYIKGNLPFDAGSNAGGPGVAAGVFDGIDIDWEFPGVIGQPYNTVSAADKQNFTLLLKEFRTQLDAIGAANNKRYALTVAIGAGKDKIEQTDPAEYTKYLDWVNVMNYDYNGGWAAQGPTDFQAHLFKDVNNPNYIDPKTGQRSLVSYYNTDEAIQQLIAKGAPRSKLLVGVPYYGRGWTGVKAGPNGDGLYQTATGAAKGTYEAGIEDYKVLKNAAGTLRYHPVTKQSYKYDGSTWWSYDTPTDIQTKVDYIKSNQLGGAFSWSLDGDTPDAELTKAMAKVRE